MKYDYWYVDAFFGFMELFCLGAACYCWLH
jgi:hypothetical protein